MELYTERIYIRLLTPEDAEAMQALRQENRAFLKVFANQRRLGRSCHLRDYGGGMD